MPRGLKTHAVFRWMGHPAPSLFYMLQALRVSPVPCRLTADNLNILHRECNLSALANDHSD